MAELKALRGSSELVLSAEVSSSQLGVRAGADAEDRGRSGSD
jgi:hypothetical protein